MNSVRGRMFVVGKTYITLAGNYVMIESYSNEDSSHETVKGSDNIHRYNRRDYGRCTGSDYECPREENLEIPGPLRYLVKWGQTKEKSSMERALPCKCCGGDFLRNTRNLHGINIRCLKCGAKSITADNTNNAVNDWNLGNYQN